MSVNTNMERGGIWLTELHNNVVLITVLVSELRPTIKKAQSQPHKLRQKSSKTSLKSETWPYQNLSYQIKTHKYQ